MYSIPFFCLKIQTAAGRDGPARPGPGVLTEQAEERMFCFKSAESSLFSALSLFLSH